MHQLTTWVLDEDIAFPTNSTFQRNHIHYFGAVIARNQNSVGVSGLCTDDDACLIDLYEMTGDGFSLDLLSDISRTVPQMLVRPGTEWGDMRHGQMTECLAFSDTCGATAASSTCAQRAGPLGQPC